MGGRAFLKDPDDQRYELVNSLLPNSQEVASEEAKAWFAATGLVQLTPGFKDAAINLAPRVQGWGWGRWGTLDASGQSMREAYLL